MINRKLIDQINSKYYIIEAERLEEQLTRFGFEYDGIYVDKIKLKIPESLYGVYMKVIIDEKKGKVTVIYQTKVKSREIEAYEVFDLNKFFAREIFNYIIDELKRQIAEVGKKNK